MSRHSASLLLELGDGLAKNAIVEHFTVLETGIAAL